MSVRTHCCHDNAREPERGTLGDKRHQRQCPGQPCEQKVPLKFNTGGERHLAAERDSCVLRVEMSRPQTSCGPTPNSRSPSVLCQSVGRGTCRDIYKGLRRICENCWAKVCPVFMRQNCDPASQERDAFSRPALRFYGQRRACGNDWLTQLS